MKIEDLERLLQKAYENPAPGMIPEYVVRKEMAAIVALKDALYEGAPELIAAARENDRLRAQLADLDVGTPHEPVAATVTRVIRRELTEALVRLETEGLRAADSDPDLLRDKLNRERRKIERECDAHREQHEAETAAAVARAEKTEAERDAAVARADEQQGRAAIAEDRLRVLRADVARLTAENRERDGALLRASELGIRLTWERDQMERTAKANLIDAMTLSDALARLETLTKERDAALASVAEFKPLADAVESWFRQDIGSYDRLVAAARHYRARTEPCGMYGCTAPKPAGAIMCSDCFAEQREDPDAFK